MQKQKSGRGVARRRFLAGAIAGIGGLLAYRWYKRQPGRLIQRRHRLITSNRDFYTVSIGGYPAKPRLEDWRLSLAGPGGNFQLSFDELSRLPSRTIEKTFMCISNPVGGDAVGNALWRVTPLSPLIERLLVGQQEELKVAFYAADGFYSSVPLRVALDPESYIAYEMNGVPLPREHGFPARVLLPGKYGMKQPRWLERIEVTRKRVSGYWEKRGWSQQSDVRMTSRIDRAERREDGTYRLLGIAYCGTAPVGQVEVSSDEGKTWQKAELTSRPRPNAWSTWRFDWDPPGPGSHLLAVRVRDSSGREQDAGYSGPYPDGATGLHRVYMEV